MKNNLIKTLLILVAGGIIGFGISWWWNRRCDDKEHCGNKGHKKECCDEKDKKHCGHDFDFDCNKGFSSKDSGAIVGWDQVTAGAKIWNNGKPLGSGTKMQGGQIHSSLVQGLVNSMGPNGGYLHYVFGVQDVNGKMDTVVYLVGGKETPGCPHTYAIMAMSFCPDRCPTGTK